MKQRNFFIVSMLYLSVVVSVSAQSSTFVDDNGIMRYAIDQKEVCVFGTNYSVPFAYWEERKALVGKNHRQAIDEDVYHIARLGIDGFRIHVMESYISDDDGNLTNNIHLELFDYLLFKLKERGIKMFITPMYLNGGKDGFAKKFGNRVGCLSNPDAFKSQTNFLKQFMSHINPNTGIAYKDDPDILAFEIVNEPNHRKAPELVKEYISTMYNAIRSTGCDKPLFYNMTSSFDFIDDVLNSKIEGGSFQWYPTGLTANHEQKGNLLPNVDQYIVPFNNQLKATKRPKFIYEFSPSDTKGAYIYPAMARSFREAGFQFAAHFSYDPLHAAHTNVEYKTHFLNLAYTPKKAIGLLIASEAFHDIPLYDSFGRFPQSNTFNVFHINYEDDLAEMISDKKFLYTNSTNTAPKNLTLLENIAGTGNSSVVNYTGTGAYFLDKLEKKVWRLEVMPDAHWVRDPFFVPYTQGEVAVTMSKKQDMKITLPDLGGNFNIKGINEGNAFNSAAKNSAFTVLPGVYILTKQGHTTSWKSTDRYKNIRLDEYYTPQRKPKLDYLLHKPPVEVSTKVALKLSVKIISETEPEQVELIILKKGGGEVLPMKKVDAYNYEVNIPGLYTQKPQLLRYHISYKIENDYLLYPEGVKDSYLLNRRIYTDDTSLDNSKPYEIRVVEEDSPIVLFDATTDWEQITKMDRKNKIDIVPSMIPNKSNIRVLYPKVNKNGNEFTFRFYCGDRVLSRQNNLKNKNELTIYSRSINSDSLNLKVQLLFKNGSAFSAHIKLENKMDFYSIALKEFEADNYILLPRPYPKFQANYSQPEMQLSFNINNLEAIQLVIREESNTLNEKPGIEIGWISVE